MSSKEGGLKMALLLYDVLVDGVMTHQVWLEWGSPFPRDPGTQHHLHLALISEEEGKRVYQVQVRDEGDL